MNSGEQRMSPHCSLVTLCQSLNPLCSSWPGFDLGRCALNESHGLQLQCQLSPDLRAHFSRKLRVVEGILSQPEAPERRFTAWQCTVAEPVPAELLVLVTRSAPDNEALGMAFSFCVYGGGVAVLPFDKCKADRVTVDLFGCLRLGLAGESEEFIRMSACTSW